MEPSQIGRYQIQRRLGRGGMGSLYLAYDPDLDRLVAIKVLRDDLQDDEEIRARFSREARSVARLRHRNIIVVFDVGEDEGRPFIAMEYIAGETLTEVLRRPTLVPLARRLAFVEDLCAGLAHAHAAGIVHRDIKPANIMLDDEGVVKILDFGIARLGNSGMTQDGFLMGSVNYMSPEQVVGRGVDRRSDIFATGAVLYEVIALEQAFPGGVDSGVLHAILHAGPVPLSARVPGIDPELAAIVHRALQREPAERYQDAHVIGQDLARVRRRLLDQGSGTEPSPHEITAIAPPRTPGSDSGRQADSDRRRRLDPERVIELRRQQVEELIRRGDEAFANGEYDAALQCAERAVIVDAESRLAYDLIDKARSAIDAEAVRQQLAGAESRHAEIQASPIRDETAVIDRSSRSVEGRATRFPVRAAYLLAGAGVVAALAVALMVARDFGDDVAPQITEPAASVPGADSTPAPPAAAPQPAAAPEARPEPPAAPKPAPMAPPKVPSVDQKVADAIDVYRQQARQLMTSGRSAEALAAVQSALRLDADDSASLAILESLAVEARREVRRAKADAVARRAPSAAAQSYRASVELEAAAQKAGLDGRIDQAVPLLWRARDAYASAAKEAEAAMRAAASAPPDPGTRPGVVQPQPSPQREKSLEPTPARPQFGARPSVDEREAIVQKLRDYATAWANLDLEAIRRIHELTGDELSAVRRTVDAAREYTLSMKVHEIRLEGDGRQATVTAEVRRRSVSKRGGDPQEVIDRSVIAMEKRVGGWIIVSLQ